MLVRCRIHSPRIHSPRIHSPRIHSPLARFLESRSHRDEAFESEHLEDDADLGRHARDDQAATLDCGSTAILENYAEWRRSDQQKLVRFTDGIVRLFGDQRPPVRVLRNLGMLGFDMIPGIRKAFAKHTMGLAGRLPRLSRGVPLA